MKKKADQLNISYESTHKIHGTGTSGTYMYLHEWLIFMLKWCIESVLFTYMFMMWLIGWSPVNLQKVWRLAG